MKPGEVFLTYDELWNHLCSFAQQQGFAVTTKHSSYCQIGKTLISKTFVCDRAGVFRSKSTGERSTRTKKVDCGFQVIPLQLTSFWVPTHRREMTLDKYSSTLARLQNHESSIWTQPRLKYCNKNIQLQLHQAHCPRKDTYSRSCIIVSSGCFDCIDASTRSAILRQSSRGLQCSDDTAKAACRGNLGTGCFPRYP